MNRGWRRKPGDRVVRVLRHPYRLHRVLGIPALYSAGYGNVGSSIYYALGIVALAAMGATPIALAIAGLLFLFTALTYAEGSALFPEAGGSAAFARHAFNDLIGFIAGWALMLSYVITIAISAFIIPPYLGYFWEPLKYNPTLGTAFSMGVIAFLMVLNILGVKETSFVNILAATIDLLLQFFIVLVGFAFLVKPGLLIERISGAWPTSSNLLLGIALATLAYTGLETVSQMAEETRRPRYRVPRALMLMVVTVLVVFISISLVALSVMPPDELANQWAADPVAGIASHLSTQLEGKTLADPELNLLFARFSRGLSSLLPPLVALLAATILLLATNAGLMGISRLAFSLGKNQQLPGAFSRVHGRFKTPYLSIAFFALMALFMLIPGYFSTRFLSSLGGLYTFGSLLAFSLAHASIIGLRIRKPDLDRPFKLAVNLKIGGRELPISALLGLGATFAIWVVIVITQPYSRWVGLAWMGLGFLLYIFYRKWRRLPLSSIPSPPPQPP